MFIIDTIITPTGETLNDIIGGAGTFSALGARLFSKPNAVGFVVDYGTDTPSHVEAAIEQLGFDLMVHRHSDRPGTRGLNTYRGDTRDFEYLTPKIRVRVDQVPDRFIRSRSFHLICSAERCIALIDELEQAREKLGATDDFITIWEPVPDACVPSARKEFEAAWRMCGIISPNMDEAATLLNVSLENLEEDAKRTRVEEMATEMYKNGAEIVVIRCSSLGAYLFSKESRGWFPAYLTSASQVVDATGGGNTFCGGFVAAMAQGESLEVGMAWGMVAAALAIQQVGLPIKNVLGDTETWNGMTVERMLSIYRQRLNGFREHQD